MENKIFDVTIMVNKSGRVIHVTIPAMISAGAMTQARLQYPSPEYTVLGAREMK